jgi:hypothetical protein
MMGGQTNEALPSPAIGFVPSEAWRRWASEREFFAAKKLPPEQIEALVAATPARDSRLRDGRRFVIVEQVAPGVVFYETT